MGDQGASGEFSAAVEGERTMIGARLLGGVGDLLFVVSGGVDSEVPPTSDSATLVKSLSGIGHRGKGARILGGRCSSGMPLYGSTGSEGAGELVGTVGVGASLLCCCLI